MNSLKRQPVELTVDSNQPMATSRQLANHFGKQHCHVLDEIRKTINALKGHMPDKWHESNFRLMKNEVKIGKGASRKDPVCLLSRDAFSLVAMGFTGKKALIWKAKYIEAFNRMEQELTRKETIPRGLFILPPESEEELHERCLGIIDGLLGFWAFQDKIPYQKVENLLCAHLNINGMHCFSFGHFLKAWNFIIQSACFLGNEGKIMEFDDVVNIENVMRASTYFRHTQDMDVKAMLESICGASVENAPVADPQRFMTIAWGLCQYASGYSIGRSLILKEIANHA